MKRLKPTNHPQATTLGEDVLSSHRTWKNPHRTRLRMKDQNLKVVVVDSHPSSSCNRVILWSPAKLLLILSSLILLLAKAILGKFRLHDTF